MVIYLLSLIGVAVFAISGVLAAGQKKLDWVGVVVLAIITSLGGGTIRDILLNREIVFWIEAQIYLVVPLMTVLLTVIIIRFIKLPIKTLLYADAIGLALFTIIGAQIAELESVSSLVVVFMGVLTGVAGGVLRDIMVGEIPLVFRSTETLYSVAALIGVLVYILLQKFGLDRTVASLLGIIVIALIRFIAIAKNIRLPELHV